MPPCNERHAIWRLSSRDPLTVDDTVGVAPDHPGWDEDDGGEKSKPCGNIVTHGGESAKTRLSRDQIMRKSTTDENKARLERERRRRPAPLSDRAAIVWFATLTAASFVLGCVVRYHLIATRTSDRGRIRDHDHHHHHHHHRIGDPLLFRDAHPPRHRPPLAGDPICDVGPAPALDVASCDALLGSDHLDWDRYRRSSHRREVSSNGGSGGGGSSEALVHPAMFAHPDPRSVGLVGMSSMDGRSALVEVLRHNTVEEVTLIGCGPLAGEGGAPSYEDDHGGDRWRIAGEEDALTWFSDNVAALNSSKDDGARFDVIIVDLRSLRGGVSACRDVLRMATDSLTPQGVVVVPLFESPSRGGDSSSSRWGDGYYARVTDALVNVERFESFSVYEESRGELGGPSSFLLACLDDCDYGWYSNEAQVNAMIHRRIDSCPEDDDDDDADDFHASSILNEFDGATMGRYQRPPKVWEYVYCRSRDPTPSDCLHMNGFDPSIPNAPASMFEVRTEDASVGRGVFATETIPAGSYVMQEKGVQSVQFPPKTSDTLERLLDGLPEEAGELRAVTRYMYGYGYESWVMGDMGHFVDSSISTFTNHGCNGTYNTAAENIMPQISRGIILSEDDADPTDMPWEEEEGDRFNPVMLRHLESYWTKNQRTFRDIQRGEEVLENYLFFTQCEGEWVETVRELRAMCSGEEIGLVVLRDSSAGDA